MQIVGLDPVLIALPPGEEEKARRFYGALLGLTEVSKPEHLAHRGGCWFEGPGTALHIGADDSFVPATRAHPAFRVLDLPAMRRALEAEGVPMVLDTNLPGVNRFFASDPFGNRIEFIQAD